MYSDNEMGTPILVVVCTLIVSYSAKNILYLAGVPGAGHHIWNRELAMGLVDRGHNVTLLTSDLEFSRHRHFHILHMDGVYDRIFSDVYRNTSQPSDPRGVWVHRAIKERYQFASYVASQLVKTNAVQFLLDYPAAFKFDIIVHDFSASPVLLGFWQRFGRPPLVSVSASNMPVHVLALTDTPAFSAAIWHPMARHSPGPLVIGDRAYNAVYHLYDRVYRKFPFMRTQNAIARRFFGDQLEPLQVIERESQLYLVNWNAVIDEMPLVPANVIAVGGLHVQRQTKLHRNTVLFLEAASRRNSTVIVFSMGTGPSALLTREQDEIFLEAFRNLTQFSFIWKYDKLEKWECPRNILMTDWLEQSVLLQEPDVKLFITSGGTLSVQEALWNGVPMIGVPLQLDQQQNVDRVQGFGAGRRLSLNQLSADRLMGMIVEMIETPSFRENASQSALLLKTQPGAVAVLEKAISWIEYAMENGNLSHLQSPIANLPIHALYNMDLMLGLAFVVIGYWFIVFKHLILDRRSLKTRPATVSTMTQTLLEPTSTTGAICDRNDD